VSVIVVLVCIAKASDGSSFGTKRTYELANYKSLKVPPASSSPLNGNSRRLITRSCRDRREDCSASQQVPRSQKKTFRPLGEQ